MAIELHLDVELLAPATIFFAQQLKSTLGEALMLVLSLFSHVHQVSTRVLDHAAAGRAARRRRTPSCSRRPPPRLHAHRSRTAALVLAPPRAAAAWPHRRQDSRAAASPALRRP